MNSTTERRASKMNALQEYEQEMRGKIRALLEGTDGERPVRIDVAYDEWDCVGLASHDLLTVDGIYNAPDGIWVHWEDDPEDLWTELATLDPRMLEDIYNALKDKQS